MRTGLQRTPQSVSHRLLIDSQGGTDRPKTHPKPPHPFRFGQNHLKLERLMREHRKLQLHLRDGSNWLQSCPPMQIAWGLPCCGR
jgi:hypothetical protein